MPARFEKRQGIQMAKDLVALGLSDLGSNTSAIYAPEEVKKTATDVTNSLCQCLLGSNGTLDTNNLQDVIDWYALHFPVDDRAR
jgi:hypothetical protein